MGVAARAQRPPREFERRSGAMADSARWARQLQAALREWEPRAVEELLRRGADPSLVQEGGAAAVHLAARARHPRALLCLRILLRRGADPNARSAEALTPVHVAAAWGCRGALELLLSRGGDPTLRDQDGLRPLDWALRQRHHSCARVLRELDRPARTPEPAEKFPVAPADLELAMCGGRVSAGSPAVSAPPRVSLASEQRTCRAERPAAQEVTVEPPEPRSSETTRSPDCSSDTFVTALEDSPQPRHPAGTPGPATGTPGPAAGRPGHPAGSPRPATGTPGHPAGTPGHPAGTPGHPAGTPGHPAGTPGHPAGTPGHPAGRPGHPAGRPGHPAGTPGPAAAPRPPRGAMAAGDEALSCQLQALTLTAEAPIVASLPGDGDPGASHPQGPVPPMSDLQLLQALRALGHSPGPVTPFTRGHYLRRLQEAQASLGHSPELAEALRTGHIPDCQAHEAALTQHFQRLDPAKRWRGGVTKSSFTYLLLDPRQTRGLPARASSLTLAECLQCFVGAIFYVGKGTRARPDAHLWEALGYRERPGKKACPKVRRILDIWASGRGVISLHCFQHAVAVEAFTREACLLDALGIQTLTNQKQGHYYGEAACWPPTQRRRLGVYLLHRALLVFLAEGERELRPQDIQARG
ncbi:ankyrin repeat and LEM domain-containing protein 1 isoform X2 [Mesocricetus auratus]|uniref:Ankyrin repeat and LEM domain-containing protein 1 isoform X2 n=1 Tax=Mesocricetus auratus TaxID=10036 RepID=A0ABM2X5C4_MESAU|nr:ankyrin repeat and LEM domain-containing protein 1 isoform X2 [Mesocricetus auratus]